MGEWPKARRVIGWFVAVITLIPLLWVLSAGPIVGAWHKWKLNGHPLTGPLTILYQPLALVTMSDSYPGRLFRGYLRLWGVPVPEPGEIVAPVGV